MEEIRRIEMYKQIAGPLCDIRSNVRVIKNCENRIAKERRELEDSYNRIVDIYTKNGFALSELPTMDEFVQMCNEGI